MTEPVYTDLQRVVLSVDIDAELLVGGYLRHELGSSYTVCSDVPDNETYAVPVIRVTRAPGGGDNTGALGDLPPGILDMALMDIDVWGRNQAETELAMRRARALSLAGRGVMLGGAVITKVEELDGPGDRPEPDDPKLYRYGFTHGVSIHPA